MVSLPHRSTHISIVRSNGMPESSVTPGPDRYVKRPNGAPINPTCGHTLCLGSQNRNSGPRAVFNETTHCALLHSLSSFTFVQGGFTTRFTFINTTVFNPSRLTIKTSSLYH